MNLKLEHQHLRLRLSAPEFEELRAGKTHALKLRMPGLHWRITAAAGAGEHLDFIPHRDGFELVFPQAKLDELATRLPAKEGLSFRLAVDAEQALEVALEVDVKRGR